MQKAISVKKIEYTVLDKHILQGVSFRATIDERLCIFGENGAGKSTLLKILAGQLEADSGTIEKHGHVRFRYVPQEFDPSAKDLTVDEYVKREAGDTLYKKAFDLGTTLGFALEKHTHTPCGALSGGQQKILALAVAFAQNPDFLLLDEPENHLDIVTRIELMTLLSDFKNGIIFISHDRLLIDAIATKIGELAQGTMHLSEGGYEDYVQMKLERIGGLQRQFDKESKRIRQLSATIVILHQKAIRGKEISAYQRTKKELAELKKAHESGRPDDAQTKIRLAESNRALHAGKLLCRIEKGSFTYEGAKQKTLDKVTLEARSGDKIVLLGRNGSGKSTFLKCLTGHLPFSTGEITWGNDITWSYFDQHAEFDPEHDAIQAVERTLPLTKSEAQAALGAMKFDLARMTTATKNLSGGERMRIRFAIAFGAKADFIILDEPTNHIDEVTWEILLDACRNSKSSLLLVTHDYEFIKAFAPNPFWMMTGHTILPRHKDLDTLLEEMKA